ncbi:MAG: hypothetical protein JWO36_5343 [Myxococcales bacterium]|nr:hypothetical protein [Myxococcales bacterium]
MNLAVTFCGGCGTGLAETKPAKPAAEAKAAKPAADAKAPKPVIPAPAVPARKAAPAHNATIPIILDDLDPTE